MADVNDLIRIIGEQQVEIRLLREAYGQAKAEVAALAGPAAAFHPEPSEEHADAPVSTEEPE